MNRQEEIERLGKMFPIEIVKYNPAWIECYEKESLRIKNALPDGLVLKVEHFGSTAVPNLDAKSVIDILIEVSSLDEAKAKAVPILKKMNYGEGWESSHIVMFGGYFPINETVKYHIHIADTGNDELKCLAFRDCLRANSQTAKEYEQLKYALAEKFRYNREAYTEAKSEFIKRVTDIAVGLTITSSNDTGVRRT